MSGLGAALRELLSIHRLTAQTHTFEDGRTLTTIVGLRDGRAVYCSTLERAR